LYEKNLAQLQKLLVYLKYCL